MYSLIKVLFYITLLSNCLSHIGDDISIEDKYIKALEEIEMLKEHLGFKLIYSDFSCGYNFCIWHLIYYDLITMSYILLKCT